MRRRQAEFFNEELGQPARRAESDDGSVGGEVYEEAEEVQDEEQVCALMAGGAGFANWLVGIYRGHDAPESEYRLGRHWL